MKFLDIWCITLDSCMINKEYKNILSYEELIAASKFTNNRDKSHYIKVHTCLRVILSKYFPYIKEEDWKFKKNKYGKPSILTNLKFNFYFNISYSNFSAYVMCSSYEKCGIDVEDIKVRNLNDDVLKLVLTKNEQVFFYKAQKNNLFYIFWTLKEAHLKALGKGLFIDPKSVEFWKYIDINNSSYFKIDNNHYWIYIFNDIILSYTILDVDIDMIESRFYILGL